VFLVRSYQKVDMLVSFVDLAEKVMDNFISNTKENTY
jgi:hypothetical protein